MTPLAAWVAAASRLYILVILAAALLGKAAAPASFRDSMAGLPGLSGRAGGAAALTVIGAEAAILAAVAIAPAPGMAAAMAMFAFFWLVILAALVNRRPMVCNCFGGRARPISWLDLVRNLALIGACAAFLLSPPPAAVAPSEWPVLLAVALIALLISTHLDEIADLAR
jgi:hypothetical protein